MKSLLGIVIGFLIAYVLFRSGGSSLFSGVPGLGISPHEQINGSTTTYSLDNAATPPFRRVGGCGCGG